MLQALVTALVQVAQSVVVLLVLAQLALVSSR